MAISTLAAAQPHILFQAARAARPQPQPDPADTTATQASDQQRRAQEAERSVNLLV